MAVIFIAFKPYTWQSLTASFKTLNITTINVGRIYLISNVIV